ncbi:ATP-binding cassette domain-containing protein [Clostridium sp. MCC353]|uniref:sugar ABC transporter ATP-binding protein n=1 Tax=Clostridium sp. MCC353 TaxID=2592646 RepID=UPI001C01A90A|nr:sugar ABC transporter ATP-binding protein [Clostridium sp. MCC353]MBT9778170.1 ATP-binding cassette domain-containing protein [Clostridium sp. MCC353]
MFDYADKHPVIAMKDIRKTFSGVTALDRISFDLYEGEIHCLVGENGAGKSTLMKILSGAYVPDSGEIVIGEKHFSSLTPRLSEENRIVIIPQENFLVNCMSVTENIFVGHEIVGKYGLIDREEMKKRIGELLNTFHVSLDPERIVETLSISEKQYVKILKALAVGPKILIMDEPTSMFNKKDSGKVLELVREIAGKGISVIYISHYLDEVVSIADRITVIRDGLVVNSYDNGNRDTKLDVITKDMVGRPVEQFFTKEPAKIGEMVLEVRDLKLKASSPKVSFYLRKGEILGFAGMVGSGRTEVIRAVAGVDRYYGGDVILNGEKTAFKNPGESIDKGIAHITEDRQHQGLMLDHSVVENAVLVGFRNKIRTFFVNQNRFPSMVKDILDGLKVKMSGYGQEVKYLSGGNQQKVVLAKWIFSEASLYIFDEPTRGIDINAKSQFYRIINNLAKQGKSVIMISSEMPELISMSDRVLVMRDGQIIQEFVREEITEEKIVKAALGVG